MKKHRKSEKDFTRNSKLTFFLLILFMLNIIRTSIQNELDNFFKTLSHSELPVHFICKSAFSKARKKVKYTVFTELIEKLEKYFYENFKIKKWHGFILKAVDGTNLYLPKSEETIKHFGLFKNSNGNDAVLARLSQIYDCQNKITNNALITPLTTCEREALLIQSGALTQDDLLLMDRGYPAFWLFAFLHHKKINFCSRIQTNQWNVVKEFFLSDAHDKIVEFNISAKKWPSFVPKDIPKHSIKLRLIKIQLSSGQTEILVTTLKNRKKYDYSVFKELYHKRWPIEEDYKTMKLRTEVENFSGKSVEAVYQDVYAKIFTKNLTSIMTNDLNEEVDKMCEERSRKHKYKINSVNALSKMKNTISLLFTSDCVSELLDEFLELLTLVLEAVRPDRRYDRRPMHPKRFYPQYKTIS